MTIKEQIIAACESTKLLSIHIAPKPDKPSGPIDSKFGGDYYLPAGAETAELEFMAQINFAQVPHLDGFPESGLLQFFLRTDAGAKGEFTEDRNAWLTDSGLFQVRWYPELSENPAAEKAEVPEARWLTRSLAGRMEFQAAEEIATFSVGNDGLCTDMGFEAAEGLLPEDDMEDTEYDPGTEEGDERFFADFGNWGCKLGGHPAIGWGDPREVDDNYPIWKAYTALLFQLDLMPGKEYGQDVFGFFMKPEDLVACRFDKVLMTRLNII